MEYLLFGWYLLPTLAVVALSFVVMRAVSVRVVWRGRDARHFDDEPAVPQCVAGEERNYPSCDD